MLFFFVSSNLFRRATWGDALIIFSEFALLDDLMSQDYLSRKDDSTPDESKVCLVLISF